MTEVRTVQPRPVPAPRDLIDVIAGHIAGGERLSTSKPQPKTGFEIVWDLAH